MQTRASICFSARCRNVRSLDGCQTSWHSKWVRHCFSIARKAAAIVSSSANEQWQWCRRLDFPITSILSLSRYVIYIDQWLFSRSSTACFRTLVGPLAVFDEDFIVFSVPSFAFCTSIYAHLCTTITTTSPTITNLVSHRPPCFQCSRCHGFHI